MRQFVCFFVFLASFAAAAAQEVRTWTDTQGRKMQAQFVREVDGDVTFIKDGKLITFPLEQLSEADQKVIRDAETNKKVEETARPAGAPAKDADPGGLLPPADSFSPAEGKSNLTKQRLVAEERTWRDLRGQQTVGKFVRMHNGNVVLTRGGRVVTVSFYSLSRADREYVRELLAARGESAQLPAGMPEEPEPASEPVPAPREAERPASPANAEGGSETGTIVRGAGEPTPEPAAEVAMRPAEISIPSGSEPTSPKRERPPLTPAAIGIVLVFMAIGVAISSAVGAVILRAAVALYNSMAGGADSDYGVPEPAFGDAFGITFITSLVNAIAGFVLGLVIGAGGLAANWSERETKIVAQLISFPVSLVVMAGMLSSMLPTTMVRAILVTLCYMVVSIFVFGIIIAIGVVVWGMAAGGN